MSEERQVNTEDGPDRAPYEPPRVIYEEVLEFLAVTCTDPNSKGDVGVCPLGPLNS